MTMDKTFVTSPHSKPTTLLTIYRQYTGDVETTEDQVMGYVSKDSEGRRRVVSLSLKGYTHRQIGRAVGISHGSVTSRIKLCMGAAFKRIHKKPRFTKGKIKECLR